MLASLRVRRLTTLVSASLLLIGGAALLRLWGPALWSRVRQATMVKRTIEGVLREMGPAAEARLRPHFDPAGIPFPPGRIALLAFKAEKTLELWAEAGGRWVLVRSYPILAASGGPGPKLRRGDRQVPEGIYRIAGLNPNSRFHLSLELDYPNAFDLDMARADGRTDLGSDIFIHGKAASSGCIAMGDSAIEELFCLVARIGTEQAQAIIAPNDLRTGPPLSPARSAPAWLPQLHQTIGEELARFSR